jgi:small multidrug resistance pump
MNSLKIGICVLLVSVFISAISQIVLKKAANKTYKSTIAEYMNPLVIGAYGMFFLSTILTTFSLKSVPLSLLPILESTSYLYVTVLGYFVLKEKFTKRKLLGLGLILIGIIVFSFQGVG